MKQSKYPPAKLRYGESLVAIEDFNFYKDDADAGNPYNTTFGIKVISFVNSMLFSATVLCCLKYVMAAMLRCLWIKQVM